MATVPTMGTWTAGEIPTAAKLNTNIRDTGNFFKAPPTGIMTRTATQSIPTATWTKVLLNTSVFNNDTMVDTTNGRLLIKTAGLYQVTATGGVTGGSTGRRILGLTKTEPLGTHIAQVESAPAVGGSWTQSLSMLVYLTTSEYLAMWLYHEQGANLSTTLAGGPDSPRLSATWVAA